MNDKKINNHLYDLGVPEDGVGYHCMIIISTDFLFIYKKKNITCKYI